MTETEAYTGFRTGTGCRVRTPRGELLPLRLDLRNHSPDGFEWGYSGSGPTQLALALLAHCMGDEVALRYYQDFRREIIAALPRYLNWTLTSLQVEQAIEQIAKARERDS